MTSHWITRPINPMLHAQPEGVESDGSQAEDLVGCRLGGVREVDAQAPAGPELGPRGAGRHLAQHSCLSWGGSGVWQPSSPAAAVTVQTCLGTRLRETLMLEADGWAGRGWDEGSRVGGRGKAKKMPRSVNGPVERDRTG
ncbi:hypothetical protein HaLaN_22238 [Haematococcus lacustris]|uniref:Uncharacterized protein n=1 Tax=Haematococcus lacustris TaxID=44745 RepID=A0A699ZQ84_HAELA|nr:hypothetical protein HaLaN_22238 [Haematococcus lacustris]